MRNFRSGALTAGVLAALATVSSTATGAQAVIGGTPDGDAHPAVAFTVAYSDGLRYPCTATLVSPTVLLTAGHCASDVDGKTAVSFASRIGDSSAELPAAANPAGGYSDTDLAGTGFHAGHAVAHPAFTGDVRDFNDVGVIVLEEPVTDIAPVSLAPEGYLDQWTTVKKQLKAQSVSVLGYGATPQVWPIERRQAEANAAKVSVHELIVDGKQGSGPCFGDSGGPALHAGYLVAVDSWVKKDSCLSAAGFARVDTPSARRWLTRYGI